MLMIQFAGKLGDPHILVGLTYAEVVAVLRGYSSSSVLNIEGLPCPITIHFMAGESNEQLKEKLHYDAKAAGASFGPKPELPQTPDNPSNN
jgi:hypothetical protein